jgi:hypothetical protein
MKPVEIGGKFHLYRPVEIPPLVRPTPILYAHGGAKITEAQLLNDRRLISGSIKLYEEDIFKLTDRKHILEDQFKLATTAPPAFDEVTRYAQLNSLTVDKQLVPILKALGGGRGKLNKKGIIEKIIDLEKAELVSDTSNIEDEIRKINERITINILEINKLDAEFRARS